MKKRIILILLLSIFFLFACTLTPPDPTPTPNPGTPTNTHQPLVMWTLTHTPFPTLTPSPTQPTPTSTTTFTSTPFSAELGIDEEPVSPGIYPAFYREGSIYIHLSSRETQELLRLYDEESTGLGTNSQGTIVSPDGKIITYSNMLDGFVYNYDLQQKFSQKIPQPESVNPYTSWTGHWSPDGKYLIYALSEFATNKSTIYIADITQNTYARTSTWEWFESNPAWSPDFQLIAFESTSSKLNAQGNVLDELQSNSDYQDGIYAWSTDIFVMSAACVTTLDTCADSVAKQLTKTGIHGEASDPLWRPNGTEIAYIYSNRDSDNSDIYLVDLDGNTTNLTNTPNIDEEVFAWSPDSEKMVIMRETNEMEEDLYILNLIDSTITQITDSPNITEGIPFWSPDGKNIAFKENDDDSLSGITLYSINDNRSHQLRNSINSNFLFWLTVFPEIKNGTTFVVSPAGQALHIRNQSSINSAIVGKLQAGDEITITGEYAGDSRYSWWRIKSDQGEGWVLQNYNWYLPK